MFAEAMKDLLPYTNLSYQLIATILLCFGIGYGLDKWLHFYPYLTVAGSVLGVVFGLVTFVKSAMELSTKKRTNTKG